MKRPFVYLVSNSIESSRKQSSGLMTILMVIVLIAFPIICIDALFGGSSFICHHEVMGKRFGFSSSSYTIHPFCTKCNQWFGYTQCNGIPEDDSYLIAMNGGQKFTDGEEYILTATVSVKYFEVYSSLHVNCKMERDNIRVSFPVIFLEEEREKVESIEDEQIITFRGICNQGGMYWTDCKLIDTESE